MFKQFLILYCSKKKNKIIKVQSNELTQIKAYIQTDKIYAFFKKNKNLIYMLTKRNKQLTKKINITWQISKKLRNTKSA